MKTYKIVYLDPNEIRINTLKEWSVDAFFTYEDVFLEFTLIKRVYPNYKFWILETLD